MNFRRRLSVLGILTLLFLAVYGIGRLYSPAIMRYVVEQALMQKLPEGVRPEAVRDRFRAQLAAVPQKDKLMKILELSKYLEKVQKLTPEELNRLLAEIGSASSLESRRFRTLSGQDDV